MRNAVALLVATLATSSCNNATGVAAELANGVPPLGSFELPDNVIATAFNRPALSLPQVTSVGVRLTNTGTSPATVDHGACSVAVWLYHRSASLEGPAWQNLASQSACIAILYRRTVAPQESYDVSGTTLGGARS